MSSVTSPPLFLFFYVLESTRVGTSPLSVYSKRNSQQNNTAKQQKPYSNPKTKTKNQKPKTEKPGRKTETKEEIQSTPARWKREQKRDPKQDKKGKERTKREARRNKSHTKARQMLEGEGATPSLISFGELLDEALV